MGLFKRDRVWWMRFTYKGKQERKSTETSDKRLAEKIYCKVILEIAEGKWFERIIGNEKTFREMIEKYMTEYSILNAESTHVRNGYLANQLNSFFGDYVLTQITPSLIVDYKSKRRKEGLAPASIEREMCMINRAFNLAVT